MTKNPVTLNSKSNPTEIQPGNPLGTNIATPPNKLDKFRFNRGPQMLITLENIRLLIPIAQLIFSAIFLVAGLRKLLAKEFTP